MFIGVDVDNTLVCYDDLLYRAALERRLVEPDAPRSKQALRDQLRGAGREDEWTELQGYVYGVYIRHAPAFDGAVDCLARWLHRADGLAIISHKTQRPYRGPDVNLHQAARDWLAASGVFGQPVGLPPEQAFFEDTLSNKLARITAVGCTHFIDDLSELLTHDDFPSGVKRILFDPHARHHDTDAYRRAGSWREIDALLTEDES